MTIRGGPHTSEVEVVDGDVRGLGVHLAARLIGLAPDELIVSSVVRDLSVGSGLDFTERGRHELKSVPGEWLVCGATGWRPARLSKVDGGHQGRSGARSASVGELSLR